MIQIACMHKDSKNIFHASPSPKRAYINKRPLRAKKIIRGCDKHSTKREGSPRQYLIIPTVYSPSNKASNHIKQN